MNLKNYCFSFKSYDQILEILRICKQNKIKPIFFVSYHLINGLGVDWLIELKNMLINQFNKNDYKFYVDSKRNYGLFIDLVETKVEFIKIKANEELCKKLKQIAKKNKVVINPSFSVVDLSKNKNKTTKLKKLYKKK